MYDLKDYNDIDLMQYNLAKFNTKLAVTMKSAKDWLANNGYTSISEGRCCWLGYVPKRT